MATDLLTVVPGSRRPIRIDSTGVVVNIAIQRSDHSSFSSNMGTNSSTSRRKPPTTYRSPSLQFPSDLCIERSAQGIRRSPSGHGPFPAPPTRSARASPGHGGAGVPAPNMPTAAVKPKYPMKPPLPIYHPLGRLALSLPQLELGVHPQNPLNQTDDTTRNGASRSRRPAARVRDATDTDSVDAAAIPLTVPGDPPAAPEKPSPRRRRNNGQSNSRRRRREADDGDATYPAKRTRANRAPAVAPSDGGSPGNGGADAADVDGSEEGLKAPERRSTRSRAAAQAKPPVRRNSSASDRTQTSVSVSIAGGQPRKEDVDVTPPHTTGRASAAPSGQSDTVSVTKGVVVEELATQGAQIGLSAPQAKGLEASIDKDEAPGDAEDTPLGASVAGTARKLEEGKPDEEAGLRPPSS